jgi:hypothetical protein
MPRALGVLLLLTLAILASACGGSSPRRERVVRPCLPLATVDEARGSVAVRYAALGADAWLALDLRQADTVLYGQDRLAAIGVRRADRTVLVPALIGASSMEVEVVTEPERPFAEGFVIGRLGRDALEDRVVEIDGEGMRLCDLYADEVPETSLHDDAAILAGPFLGRRTLVRVERGEGRVGTRTPSTSR